MSTPETNAENERHALRWLACVLLAGVVGLVGAGFVCSGIYHLLKCSA